MESKNILNNNKGKIAIFQIMVLLIGILAFSFLISQATTVSALVDSDKDGVPDSIDDCKDTYGLKDNGCPLEFEGYGGGEFGGGGAGGSWSDPAQSKSPTGASVSKEEKDDEGTLQKLQGITKGIGDAAGAGNSIAGLADKLKGDKDEPQDVPGDSERKGDTIDKLEEMNKDKQSEDTGNQDSGDKDTGGDWGKWSGYGLFSGDFWGGNFLTGVTLDGAGFWGSLNYMFSSMAVAAAASYLVAGVWSIWAGERNTQMLLNQAALAGIGAGAGFAGGTALYTAMFSATASGPPGWAIAIVGAAVAGIYGALNYQEFAQEQITFMPGAWSPPTGGENCEECNELRYGCSEYQCHTYGKSCGIINKGTEKEKCVHLNPDDTTPPKITALKDSLPEGFKYNPITIEAVDPPARGVQVVQESGEECIPPYTGLSLGVNTSEPSECRMDVERKDSYENMLTPISEGYKQYRHPFGIPSSAMPSGDAINASFKGNSTTEMENMIKDFNLKEANDYEFYIRCRDTNGNVVPQSFVIKTCVEDGPDTQAPEILRTNYEGGEAFVKFNESSYPVSVTTNEPATCRWSRENLAYEDMKNNITKRTEVISDRYTYQGNLTGIKDREENRFYIKCQDKPWWDEGESGKPYANKEPYTLLLKGTEPLLIDEATVNGMGNNSLIEDSTDEVRVDFEIETSSGANHGKSRCFYGTDKGNENIQFYNQGNDGFTKTSTQNKLYLGEGNYTYYFKCVDEGGNSVRTSLSFNIEIDRESPNVVRAYKQQESLNIITEEKGNCVYSLKDDRGCTYEYDEGIEMETSSEGKMHSTEWKPEETFYIKCEDEYGNKALPGACSIVVRPFEI